MKASEQKGRAEVDCQPSTSKSAQVPRTKDEAICIVQFDENSKRTSLNEDAFMKVLNSQPEVMEMPTIVISVGGVARTGKSFLLNLFVNYLAFLDQNKTDGEWERSNTPLDGVNWAQGKHAVTLGIWMWSRPFVIPTCDGSKVAVLLLDCQGTGDRQRSDAAVDTLIMYTSLQLASVQLLNIKGNLTSNDMFSLQLCADYADYGSSESDENEDIDFLFNSLMLVVRDYESGPELGEEETLFDEIVREVSNHGLKDVVLGIKKAFHRISAYNFPHPGHAIATATGKSQTWRVNDVPETFLSIGKSLIRALCNLELTKTRQQTWTTGQELANRFILTKFRLESEDMPELDNPTSALQETIVSKAFGAMQLEFDNLMNKFVLPEHLQQFESEKEYQEAYNKEVELMKERFKKAGKYSKIGKTKAWKKHSQMSTTIVKNGYRVLKIEFDKEKLRKDFASKVEDLAEQRARDREDFVKEKSKHEKEIEDLRRNGFKSEKERKIKEAEFRKSICQLNDANKRLLNKMQSNMDHLQREHNGKMSKAQREFKELMGEKIGNMNQEYERKTEELVSKRIKELNLVPESEPTTIVKYVERKESHAAKAARIGGMILGPPGALLGAFGGWIRDKLSSESPVPDVD